MNEWLSLYTVQFEYPLKWCTCSAIWLLAQGTFCVHNTIRTSLQCSSKPPAQGACVASCNLPPAALLSQRAGAFACYWLVTQEWSRYQSKSQYEKLALYLHSCQESECELVITVRPSRLTAVQVWQNLYVVIFLDTTCNLVKVIHIKLWNWLHTCLPSKEAGYVWCLPLVWNLRVVTWFSLYISSHVLLPNPVFFFFNLVLFMQMVHSAAFYFILFLLNIVQYFSLRQASADFFFFFY